ncbi:flagella basal body P-ring formation protein FlgA [Sphingobium aquiterrae]|uniref:flagella basal body P-ring formation protein FlgA n=1 Tax=Sphingobium aquiterrae TaxID=2038656 RepID=UPI0030167547
MSSFAAGPALAQQKFENLDRIDSLVAMTVGANMGQPGGPVAAVDRRLKLAACPQVPNVDGPVFGAAIVKCDALGWRIRVPLVPGGAAAAAVAQRPAQARMAAMRQAPAAQKEMVVRRGDPVELVAGGANFSVSRQMVADEDGAPGDMIRVREDKKSPPVIAQVVEIGVVRISSFKDF